MDFLIHWPPGPMVATVQCQGLGMHSHYADNVFYTYRNIQLDRLSFLEAKVQFRGGGVLYFFLLLSLLTLQAPLQQSQQGMSQQKYCIKFSVKCMEVHLIKLILVLYYDIIQKSKILWVTFKKDENIQYATSCILSRKFQTLAHLAHINQLVSYTLYSLKRL